MKKILCVLCVMFVLLLGSTAVLADPHAEPDTDNSVQVITLLVKS